jgi:hypothetical protein
LRMLRRSGRRISNVRSISLGAIMACRKTALKSLTASAEASNVHPYATVKCCLVRCWPMIAPAAKGGAANPYSTLTPKSKRSAGDDAPAP